MHLPRAIACATLLLAAPPSPAGPAPDIAGHWTYVSACQDGATIRGEVFLHRIPGGDHRGVLANDLGLAAEIFATIAGGTVTSGIDWAGATTRALGLLAPDGRSWIVVESESCRSGFTRSST